MILNENTIATVKQQFYTKQQKKVENKFTHTNTTHLQSKDSQRVHKKKVNSTG